jgi:hypothetical protein
MDRAGQHYTEITLGKRPIQLEYKETEGTCFNTLGVPGNDKTRAAPALWILCCAISMAGTKKSDTAWVFNSKQVANVSGRYSARLTSKCIWVQQDSVPRSSTALPAYPVHWIQLPAKYIHKAHNIEQTSF